MAKANPFRFSTKYQDDETGLLHFGYRYLKEGRWLSRDPIGEWGGLNEYSFVGGDSIDVFDFLGLAGYKFDDKGWEYVPRTDMQRGLYGETPTEVYEIGSECKETKKCWQPRFTFKVKTESKILDKGDTAWSGSGAGVLDPKVRVVFQGNANHWARRIAVRGHEKEHRKHAKKDYNLTVAELKKREDNSFASQASCEAEAQKIIAAALLYFNALENSAAAQIEAGNY